MMTNFWYSLKIRDKYFLTVSGSQMHLLLTQHATTTAVFKSSYCAKCVITFDNKQDLIGKQLILGIRQFEDNWKNDQGEDVTSLKTKIIKMEPSEMKPSPAGDKPPF